MKIICIGRNYVAHAEELKNDVPKEPLFFLKPDSAVLPNRNPLYIPDWTNDLHYEVELIVRINRLGKYISEEHASKYYSEIGLGIDFTARDLQRELKAKGHPWEKAKGFDGSAVISKKFIPLTEIEDFPNLNFSLKKNDNTVQVGKPESMIFQIDNIIAYVSQFMTLKIGDLIFTGTPAGVGPVNRGDVLKGFIEDQQMFEVNIK